MVLEVTKWKLLALLIAIGLAACVVTSARDVRDAICAAYLVLPLALIWFPEVFGEFTGYLGRGADVDVETPPALASAAGWFLLVGLPAIVWLVSAHGCTT